MKEMLWEVKSLSLSAHSEQARKYHNFHIAYYTVTEELKTASE